MKKYLFRISLISSMGISYIIALILFAMYQLAESLRPYGYGLGRRSLPEFSQESIIWSFFVSLIFVYPIVLTGYHIVLLSESQAFKENTAFDGDYFNVCNVSLGN